MNVKHSALSCTLIFVNKIPCTAIVTIHYPSNLKNRHLCKNENFAYFLDPASSLKNGWFTTPMIGSPDVLSYTPIKTVTHGKP